MDKNWQKPGGTARISVPSCRYHVFCEQQGNPPFNVPSVNCTSSNNNIFTGKQMGFQSCKTFICSAAFPFTGEIKGSLWFKTELNQNLDKI